MSAKLLHQTAAAVGKAKSPRSNTTATQLNVAAIAEMEREATACRSVGERMGDAIARHAGRLWFISAHVIWFGGWIFLNAGLIRRVHPFDAIAQKRINDRITLRVNTGILFSGNTLTGVIGVKSTRGAVFTSASSLTYQFNKRWLLGGEIAGALTDQFGLGKAQLQTQFGAKYALRKSLGLDFAVTGGRFEGSPRVGGAFGISVDF